ncbi:hypothetical protein H5410_057623 [Solanum commersonii]|uniref:Uncharacterized protein n=1 Tax=Solanum commersonii TaxID=4109 RepID=A0A9J5WNL5_SOLCO|nr:hypothetical protein H5410_057623 [Solanum commersonii]
MYMSSPRLIIINTLRGGPVVWAWDFHVGGLKFETLCQQKQARDLPSGRSSPRPLALSGGYLSYVVYEAITYELGDDTIIFCEAKASQITFIRATLVIFEAVYGLSVNWRKSCIFPIKEIPQLQRW